jgi:hypothetical protein
MTFCNGIHSRAMRKVACRLIAAVQHDQQRRCAFFAGTRNEEFVFPAARVAMMHARDKLCLGNNGISARIVMRTVAVFNRGMPAVERPSLKSIAVMHA